MHADRFRTFRTLTNEEDRYGPRVCKLLYGPAPYWAAALIG
jgi:hypothetical protein